MKYIVWLTFFVTLNLFAEEPKRELSLGAPLAPSGQNKDPSQILPENLEERVGLTEKFGSQIPGDLQFYDHQGNKRRIEEYLNDDRAILLNLVYFNCPSICNEVLNSVTEAMQKLPWDVGEGFKVLTVSINPDEQYPLAFRKRHSYIEYYGKPAAHEDWAFLTGQKEDIQVLADTVGFGFQYQEDIGEYAHPAVTILLSPEGKVMRYLEGAVVTPLNLKLGLVESGEGKVGTGIDRALLRYCYAYDPKARGYSLVAMRVMTGGGAVTLALIASVMFVLWRREIKNGGIK